MTNRIVRLQKDDTYQINLVLDNIEAGETPIFETSSSIISVSPTGLVTVLPAATPDDVAMVDVFNQDDEYLTSYFFDIEASDGTDETIQGPETHEDAHPDKISLMVSGDAGSDVTLWDEAGNVIAIGQLDALGFVRFAQVDRQNIKMQRLVRQDLKITHLNLKRRRVAAGDQEVLPNPPAAPNIAVSAGTWLDLYDQYAYEVSTTTELQAGDVLELRRESDDGLLGTHTSVADESGYNFGLGRSAESAPLSVYLKLIRAGQEASSVATNVPSSGNVPAAPVVGDISTVPLAHGGSNLQVWRGLFGDADGYVYGFRYLNGATSSMLKFHPAGDFIETKAAASNVSGGVLDALLVGSNLFAIITASPRVIAKRALTGTTATTVTSQDSGAEFMATDGTYLYTIATYGGQISKYNVSNLGTVFATNLAINTLSGGTTFKGIAVIGGYIYALADSQRKVYRMPTGGGTAELVATISSPAGYSTLEGMTAGPDGYLYISDQGANVIHRLDPATGDHAVYAGTAGEYGTADGEGSGRLASPAYLKAIGDALYVVENGRSGSIRKVSLPSGTPAPVPSRPYIAHNPGTGAGWLLNTSIIQDVVVTQEGPIQDVTVWFEGYLSNTGGLTFELLRENLTLIASRTITPAQIGTASGGVPITLTVSNGPMATVGETLKIRITQTGSSMWRVRSGNMPYGPACYNGGTLQSGVDLAFSINKGVAAGTTTVAPTTTQAPGDPLVTFEGMTSWEQVGSNPNRNVYQISSSQVSSPTGGRNDIVLSWNTRSNMTKTYAAALIAGDGSGHALLHRRFNDAEWVVEDGSFHSHQFKFPSGLTPGKQYYYAVADSGGPWVRSNSYTVG